MRNFLKIAEGINVDPIAFALLQNPDLWDERTLRKEIDQSPHTGMQDIWVRYNDETKYKKSGDYTGFHNPHFPIWYPVINKLPMIKPLALGLMSKMGATHLGGILITKIPAGGKVDPHIDNNWHARFFNCKLYIPIQSNEACVNRCEDELVVMRAGECWYFNNAVEHEVTNNGKDDRMTLIICMRVE